MSDLHVTGTDIFPAVYFTYAHGFKGLPQTVTKMTLKNLYKPEHDPYNLNFISDKIIPLVSVFVQKATC